MLGLRVRLRVQEPSKDTCALSSWSGQAVWGRCAGISTAAARLLGLILPTDLFFFFFFNLAKSLKALIPLVLLELKGKVERGNNTLPGRPQFATLQNGERHCPIHSNRQQHHSMKS